MVERVWTSKAIESIALKIKGQTMSAEARITELQLELPPAPKAMGVYKPIVVVGNIGRGRRRV